MKKILMFGLAVISGIMLAACGDETSNNEEGSVAKVEGSKESSGEKIEVDKGLLSVEVVLPASMFEGQDIDAVISEAKSEGVDEITKNGDGSLTYKMSKSKHKEMMEDMKTSVLESIEETKSSGDYQSIKDITYNNDFTELDVLVVKEAFENSFDGFVVMGLGLSSMYYQTFNGTDPKATINIKDETTGEIIQTVVYPDAFNE